MHITLCIYVGTEYWLVATNTLSLKAKVASKMHEVLKGRVECSLLHSRYSYLTLHLKKYASIKDLVHIYIN